MGQQDEPLINYCTDTALHNSKTKVIHSVVSLLSYPANTHPKSTYLRLNPRIFNIHILWYLQRLNLT